MTQRRMLTGDTPTGQLHLGHWVGSVRRRVELQSQAECFVLIANMHAFTTRSEKPDEIRRDTSRKKLPRDSGSQVVAAIAAAAATSGRL